MLLEAAQTAYALFCIALAGGRIGLDGPASFFQHLTFVCISFHALFAWVGVAGFVVPWIDTVLYLFAYVPLWSTTWVVAVLSVPLVHLTPEMITERSMGLGTTLTFNWVVHVLPLLALLCLTIARIDHVRATFRRMWPKRAPGWWLFLVFVVQPLAVPVAYLALVDPTVAYTVPPSIPAPLIWAGIVTTALASGWGLVVSIHRKK